MKQSSKSVSVNDVVSFKNGSMHVNGELFANMVSYVSIESRVKSNNDEAFTTFKVVHMNEQGEEEEMNFIAKLDGIDVVEGYTKVSD